MTLKAVLNRLVSDFVSENYPDDSIIYIDLSEIAWSRDIKNIIERYKLDGLENFGYRRLVFLNAPSVSEGIDLCMEIPPMLCYACIYLKGALLYENIDSGV
jgi:hypothetical protein